MPAILFVADALIHRGIVPLVIFNSVGGGLWCLLFCFAGADSRVTFLIALVMFRGNLLPAFLLFAGAGYRELLRYIVSRRRCWAEGM